MAHIPDSDKLIHHVATQLKTLEVQSRKTVKESQSRKTGSQMALDQQETDKVDEYPYVSIRDHERYKGRSDMLRMLNEKGKEDCEISSRHYTLQNRPPPSCLTGFRVQHLRVAMIGQTGVGKSATANTILAGKFFSASMSSKSVTIETSIATSKFGENRRISVVDSPGVNDTEKEEKETMTEISRIAYLLREGVHVFVFVWSARNTRFTDDAKNALAAIREELGTFTKHCLIVYTNAESELKNMTLDDFIKQQKSHKKMSEFLEDIDWKVVAVNNTTDIPAEQEESQRRLIDMIDKIVDVNLQTGQVYTNRIFQEIRKIHGALVEKCAKEKYHQALITAVIELYNSSTKNEGYQDKDKLLVDVLHILQKSETGSESNNTITLSNDDVKEELSYDECREQVWDIYKKVDSAVENEIKPFLLSLLHTVSAGGAIGAVVGLIGGPIGVLVGGAIGMAVGVIANKQLIDIGRKIRVTINPK